MCETQEFGDTESGTSRETDLPKGRGNRKVERSLKEGREVPDIVYVDVGIREETVPDTKHVTPKNPFE